MMLYLNYLTLCVHDSHEDEAEGHVLPVALAGDCAFLYDDRRWGHVPAMNVDSRVDPPNDERSPAVWPWNEESSHHPWTGLQAGSTQIHRPHNRHHTMPAVEAKRGKYCIPSVCSMPSQIIATTWIQSDSPHTHPLTTVAHWRQRAKFAILNDWAIALRSDHAGGVVHGNLTPELVSVAHGRGVLNPLVLSHHSMGRARGSMPADVSDVSGARWAATEFFRLDNGDPCPTKMSDVYSFGCLMLQVLTGSVPYCGTKRSEQVVYLKYLGREPIDKQTPKVADHHIVFMRWCWSPEPEKRPSIETVVDFLQGEISKLEERCN